MKFVAYNGDKISKLSLGTVQFGLDYGIANLDGQPTQEKIDEIMNYVYTEGINCFDTAQDYGNSEKVLKSSLDGKSNTFVISKLKSNIFQKNAQENVSKSLNNLGISSLYALLLHDSELLYNWTDKDSSIVDSLIISGKIKYFGVSIYTSADFELAINNSKIEFIQIPFNLFDQRAINQNWFEKARKNNKLLFIRSIFLQGLLLMDIDKIPKKLESVKKHIEIINTLSKSLNISKNELALSFVDTVATDSLILFGCDNLQQAKENLENYSVLKNLTKSTIMEISEKLSNIDENIYNPAKW